MNAGVVNANIFPPGTGEQLSGKSDIFDQDAFLKLLVTQLRYQNPSEPMSNTEFLAQSAQFSSLEQMTNLNTSVKALVELQKSSSRTAALNLIGKDVVVQQSTLSLSGDLPVDLVYSLSADADVAITIYGANEEPVRVINTRDQLAGEHTLVWDGLDGEGIRMPAGEYTYKIAAVDADGNEVSASGIVSGVVDGLILGDEPYISIGGARVPLSAVAEVSLDVPES